MADPRYEFFSISVDQEANRALVRQISSAAVASIRPNEADFTPYAFDELLVRAVQGQVARVGTGTVYGLGGAELLLFVIVPLVTNALTAAFVAAKVAGIGGLTRADQQEVQISRQEIEAIIRQSRVRVPCQEIDRLYIEINRLLPETLERTIVQQAGQPPVRCGAYNCAALRELLTVSFSLDELRTLCLDLNEPHEDMIVALLSVSVVNLIEYFARRVRLDELVDYARGKRPQIDWSGLTPPL